MKTLLTTSLFFLALICTSQSLDDQLFELSEKGIFDPPYTAASLEDLRLYQQLAKQRIAELTDPNSFDYKDLERNIARCQDILEQQPILDNEINCGELHERILQEVAGQVLFDWVLFEDQKGLAIQGDSLKIKMVTDEIISTYDLLNSNGKLSNPVPKDELLQLNNDWQYCRKKSILVNSDSLYENEKQFIEKQQALNSAIDDLARSENELRLMNSNSDRLNQSLKNERAINARIELRLQEMKKAYVENRSIIPINRLTIGKIMVDKPKQKDAYFRVLESELQNIAEAHSVGWFTTFIKNQSDEQNISYKRALSQVEGYYYNPLKKNDPYKGVRYDFYTKIARVEIYKFDTTSLKSVPASPQTQISTPVLRSHNIERKNGVISLSDNGNIEDYDLNQEAEDYINRQLNFIETLNKAATEQMRILRTDYRSDKADLIRKRDSSDEQIEKLTRELKITQDSIDWLSDKILRLRETDLPKLTIAYRKYQDAFTRGYTEKYSFPNKPVIFYTDNSNKTTEDMMIESVNDIYDNARNRSQRNSETVVLQGQKSNGSEYYDLINKAITYSPDIVAFRIIAIANFNHEDFGNALYINIAFRTQWTSRDISKPSIDLANEVLKDESTGLLWKRQLVRANIKDDNEFGLSGAQLNLVPKDGGWRVPTVKELEVLRSMIIDGSPEQLAQMKQINLIVENKPLWSATTTRQGLERLCLIYKDGIASIEARSNGMSGYAVFVK